MAKQIGKVERTSEELEAVATLKDYRLRAPGVSARDARAALRTIARIQRMLSQAERVRRLFLRVEGVSLGVSLGSLSAPRSKSLREIGAGDPD